jgi:hypothetical protein
MFPAAIFAARAVTFSSGDNEISRVRLLHMYYTIEQHSRHLNPTLSLYIPALINILVIICVQLYIYTRSVEAIITALWGYQIV